MAINYKKGIKTVLEHLGKNNNPAYVVVAIATAKGIFRPIFTMMDKKESPETKKYTALREGLTEVIAIPTYLLCGAIAGKGAALIKEPEKAKIAKHNLRFLGVCMAALIVIPGACSLLVKPFTNKIFHNSKNNSNEKQKNLDITSKSEQPTLTTLNTTKPRPVFHPTTVNFASFLNSGMKVG